VIYYEEFYRWECSFHPR